MRKGMQIVKRKVKDWSRSLLKSDAGIDGILVTVGLRIIELLLCVVMMDSLQKFIEGIIEALTQEANKILTGVSG